MAMRSKTLIRGMLSAKRLILLMMALAALTCTSAGAKELNKGGSNPNAVSDTFEYKLFIYNACKKKSLNIDLLDLKNYKGFDEPTLYYQGKKCGKTGKNCGNFAPNTIAEVRWSLTESSSTPWKKIPKKLAFDMKIRAGVVGMWDPPVNMRFEHHGKYLDESMNTTGSWHQYSEDKCLGASPVPRIYKEVQDDTDFINRISDKMGSPKDPKAKRIAKGAFAYGVELIAKLGGWNPGTVYKQHYYMIITDYDMGDTPTTEYFSPVPNK
jgi:hypothetical protein